MTLLHVLSATLPPPYTPNLSGPHHFCLLLLLQLVPPVHLGSLGDEKCAFISVIGYPASSMPGDTLVFLQCARPHLLRAVHACSRCACSCMLTRQRVRAYAPTAKYPHSLVCFQIILPVIFVCLAMFFSKFVPAVVQEPPLEMHPWLLLKHSSRTNGLHLHMFFRWLYQPYPHFNFFYDSNALLWDYVQKSNWALCHNFFYSRL